jgi:hypothetical protein
MIRRVTFARSAVSLAALTALIGIDRPLAAAPDVDACMAEARTRAANAIAHGATRYDARRQLESDVVLCQNPHVGSATAAFIGTINADLADFAQQFMLGQIDAIEYRNARLDRSRKLRQLSDDVKLHAALERGDQDGDLIPDDRDRCRATPRGTPTDDAGCPVAGTRGGPAGVPADLRRLLKGLTLLKNEACNGAPEPRTSQPFRYGRSSTNSPIPAGSLKLVVAQVDGMPNGCELFYEFRLLFLDPANSTLAPTKEVSVVFSQNEDINPDATIATFGFPVGQTLSPGRTAAFDAFKVYQRMKWRVRTAIGGPVTSPWSMAITQQPMVSGIP